jgi:hypothetical protein
MCTTTHTFRSSSTAGTNPDNPTSRRCPNSPRCRRSRAMDSSRSSRNVFPPRFARSIRAASSASSSPFLQRSRAAASLRSRMTPFTPVRPGPIPIESTCCECASISSSTCLPHDPSNSLSWSLLSDEAERAGEEDRLEA